MLLKMVHGSNFEILNFLSLFILTTLGARELVRRGLQKNRSDSEEKCAIQIMLSSVLSALVEIYWKELLLRKESQVCTYLCVIIIISIKLNLLNISGSILINMPSLFLNLLVDTSRSSSPLTPLSGKQVKDSRTASNAKATQCNLVCIF